MPTVSACAAPLEISSSAPEIIPGLPQDIAVQCLLKVPRIYHATLTSVCIAWRNVVRHPEFYPQRRRLGIADPWLVIISTEICSAPQLLYSAYDLSTKNLLFKVKFPPSVGAVRMHVAADHDQRSESPVAEASGSPDHYRVAAMNECFTVLGISWRRRMRAPHCSLTIYNTVTDEWRCGAPQSVCREMFACGAIADRLYVAGGVNGRGETEITTEVYDFSTDTWSSAAPLPADVRTVHTDAVFQGKLYVHATSSRSGGCFLWAYNPQKDAWQAEGALPMGTQQLFAGDKFLYAVGAGEEVYRLDHSSQCWMAVGRCTSFGLPRGGDIKCRPPSLALYNLRPSQIAFGHGSDVFFIKDSSHRGRGLPSDSVTKCHRLLPVKPGCYYAGAVVKA